eukprot:6114557-Prymnesium_polylepis.2
MPLPSTKPPTYVAKAVDDTSASAAYMAARPAALSSVPASTNSRLPPATSATCPTRGKRRRPGRPSESWRRRERESKGDGEEGCSRTCGQDL